MSAFSLSTFVQIWDSPKKSGHFFFIQQSCSGLRNISIIFERQKIFSRVSNDFDRDFWTKNKKPDIYFSRSKMLKLSQQIFWPIQVIEWEKSIGRHANNSSKTCFACPRVSSRDANFSQYWPYITLWPT